MTDPHFNDLVDSVCPKCGQYMYQGIHIDTGTTICPKPLIQRPIRGGELKSSPDGGYTPNDAERNS